MDWKTFWDRPNAIYVNDRHRTIHYAGIADDIIRLLPGPDATVLDYGSGEALHADRIANACGQLFLLDAAPSVRVKLAERFATTPRIAILAPENLAELADRSLDLVIANSLVQYLSADDFDGCLATWHAKLRPTGQLVLADVIPPNVSPVTDAVALLRFARQHSFLWPAIAGLVRTIASPYTKLRRTVGLATYEEGEMLDRLGAAGFVAYRAQRNLGHNQVRMTFIAKPA
jgi:SAM-dependent methyltransferase